MEQNIPIVAKKIWKIVRVAYFMLRKGMSKKKLVLNLNMMKHRSKITSKALIRHLIFHHNHHDAAAATSDPHTLPNPADGGEYEFSCSSTPLYQQYLPKRKNHRSHVMNTCMAREGVDREVNFEEVSKALEMIVSNDVNGDSPALPGPGFGLGFGPSPINVRQLRITDSPYPIQNPDPEDHRIDHEAEEFINRFYSQLIKQQKQL